MSEGLTDRGAEHELYQRHQGRYESAIRQRAGCAAAADVTGGGDCGNGIASLSHEEACERGLSVRRYPSWLPV